MKQFNVSGYIVSDDEKWIYDFCGISAVCRKDIQGFLKDADGEEIEMLIDCFGGYVRVASDVYSDLRAYGGKSTAIITGISASASTILMLGCGTVKASPTARIMIHNAMAASEGDYRDLEHAAYQLKGCNQAIINAYEIKTGLDRAALAAMMDKETWLTAQEAKNLKFIDEITLKEGEQLSDLQISAAMEISQSAYAAFGSLNHQKLRELAERLKDGAATQNTQEQLPARPDTVEKEDNGEAMAAQRKEMNALRAKLVSIN